jgi:putative SOS response-associated peptidase YedK
MCGRYTNTAGPDEISKALGVDVIGTDGTRRFNVAPTQEVLAIAAPAGEPEAMLMRWGLMPAWMKDHKNAYKMINARLESVTTKRTYSTLIADGSHRALQVADGWFEWLKAEKPGQPRQPFHFQVDGGVVFAFASLWTQTKDDELDWLKSITLLTCDSSANAVARAVHDRMPVILTDRDAQHAWLDPSVKTEEALALCLPLPTERVSVKPANPAVNGVRGVTEGPELLVATASA